MKYNTKNYDYLIVGAGPYGSVFAYEAAKRVKKSLIIERRAHIGGRLGNYQYYDMDQVFGVALKAVEKEFKD